ncbi:hypothetical protein CWI75_11725 [Kineobactrum sediminis]|uniref:DUF485 domain-containing protein n=1 Tax=Kineobactrum sediminis TaxID=1905677 RepID=A0A2N5Y202_9GAMM|nr:DUF485 domain-containing protein [Kineobactrum sediminis]PLW82424.1 hypothetical protein CWI75_11725 [Kineobactrum sediminis]
MNHDQKLAVIKSRTRRRMLFSMTTLVLYFAFILNWTEFGSILAQRLGKSHITGSLLMFCGLIVTFILLELLFLLLNQATTRSGEDV